MSHPIALWGSWPSMPRVLLIPIGVAIAVVFLLFAAALGAERNSQGTLVEAQADLAVAQDVIASHATTMRTQGVRLLQVTMGSMSPHRDHRANDARQMVADGSRLETTARMIGNQARLLGAHPGQAVRSDLSFVHDTGSALMAEGDELVTHGQAMREYGLADAAPADAALVRADADGLINAGVRTRTVGVALQQKGDQFMRSLGR